MSIKIMNEAWEVKDIEPTAKLILMCLADHANEDDRTCWPAMSTIARKCDVSKRTVQRYMRKLEEIGHIKQRSRTGDSSLFYIMPEGCANLSPMTTVSRGGDNTVMGGGDTAVTLTTIEPSRTVTSIKCAVPAVPALFYEPDFEDFWQAFPSRRKRGKAKCREMFKKIVVKTGIDPDVIIRAAKLRHGMDADPEYSPMPATWLRGEGWEEDPPEAFSKPKSNKSKQLEALAKWVNDDQPEQEMKNVTPQNGHSPAHSILSSD